MKLSIVAIRAALWACFITAIYAHNIPPHSSSSVHASPAHVTSVCGKRHHPSPLRNETKEEEETPGPPIPTGQPLGPISPSSPAVNLTIMGDDFSDDFLSKRQSCGGRNVTFNRSTVFGPGGLPPDPSGAQANNVIFTTANSYAAVSVDGGATFHILDATVYSGPANPATDGGFCCDQVVHYIPQIDRFVWLMLYWPTRGINKMRIISFHPRDVDTSGINSWLFLDLLSGTFNLPGGLDYPDMAVGDNWLYVSATNSGVGLIVVRVPLSGLDVAGPLTVWYTDPELGDVAYFSHLSQNAGDTVFWGGHSSLGTTMRIFKWPEAGITYFWSDIRINDWPADTANFNSPCPGGGPNWVFDAQFHDIIGVTRRSRDEVWFSWPAPSGSGFPNLHVQVVQINPVNWPRLVLVKQWQIWNPDFAFGYPSLYTNDCGDVGLAVAFGGGQYFPSSAVGVADSSGILARTVWYPALSDVCENRWGDYLTVRQAGPGGTEYAAFLYSQSNSSSGINRASRYVQFGRT